MDLRGLDSEAELLAELSTLGMVADHCNRGSCRSWQEYAYSRFDWDEYRSSAGGKKRRGMTIDLGYAFMPLRMVRALLFIDVPGHEKIYQQHAGGRVMLAMPLLVLACDDGVMPQTREHLQILKRFTFAQFDLSTD